MSDQSHLSSDSSSPQSGHTPLNGSVSQKVQEVTVGGGSKESDMRASFSETYATENEPQVSAELKEHGVELSPNPKVPVLTVHDKSAGIGHSPSSDQPVVPPFLLTEQQAHYIEKTAKKDTSLFWFAGLVAKHFKKLHRRLVKNES